MSGNLGLARFASGKRAGIAGNERKLANAHLSKYNLVISYRRKHPARRQGLRQTTATDTRSLNLPEWPQNSPEPLWPDQGRPGADVALSVSMHIFEHVSVCVSARVRVSRCVPAVYPLFCLSYWLSACLSVSLSPSVSVSVFVSVSCVAHSGPLPVCQPACLGLHLSLGSCVCVCGVSDLP